MRGGALAAVLLAATGAFTPAAAQLPGPIAPDGPPPTSRPSFDPVPPSASPVRGETLDDLPRGEPDRQPIRRPPPPSVLGEPVAVLGEPVRPVANPIPTTAPDADPVPAGFSERPASQKPSRAAVLGAPTAAARVPVGAVEAPAPGPTGPRPADPVNDFLARRSGYKTDAPRRDEPPGGRPSWKFGEKLEGVMGNRSEWFRSDHCFDGFISPVTNPFLFEDPRSLTEVRPLFLYQRIPGGQPDFFGGNVSFFGTQARLAVTDRLSFVVHKLGGIWLNPGSASPIDGEAGFAEIWLGPKFTFIRNEQSGSLLAGGAQFQLPVGSKNAFQDTGSLSIVPYASYAQNWFRDLRVGSFNTITTAGYAFSTTKARSDYVFLSGHVDMDVGNWHRFYPLAELNYLLYTTNGNTYPIGAEGRDLFNFGGQAKGRGLLTGALGARFKITESAQLGAAFEMPLAGPRDLFQYRFTADFILRY